jgi:hypothetical protein
MDQDHQEFVGVVSVDAAGWVVWYYTANSDTAGGGHMGIPAVWDFLPAADDYSLVLLQARRRRRRTVAVAPSPSPSPPSLSLSRRHCRAVAPSGAHHKCNRACARVLCGAARRRLAAAAASAGRVREGLYAGRHVLEVELGAQPGLGARRPRAAAHPGASRVVRFSWCKPRPSCRALCFLRARRATDAGQR